MKPSIVAIALLAAAAVTAASAYQAATRQRDYSMLLARGDAALRDDRPFAAIEAYSGAIALRGESMIAYLRRGQTYQRRGDQGDLERAANDFRTAAGLDPSATRPLEALGDVLYQLQRYDRAAEAYERFLRIEDRSARVTCRLALARYRMRDLSGAMSAAADALRLDDRAADAQYLLGLCLRETKQTAAALRAFEAAVALDPRMIPAHEELADLYGALDRHSEQLEQLQLLAVLDRDDVSRQVAVGMAHARAGHWDLAVLALGSALERNPNEPDIYRALGHVWLERPRDDRAFLSKAHQALERVASSPAATSQALTLFARALQQEGNAVAAEHALQDAMSRFPVEPSAFLLYATAAERSDRFEAARQALIQYVGLVDASASALTARIGSLSMRLNDPATAATWFRRAAAASPGDLRIAALLADAQLRAGDREAARATIDRALQKEPQNVQILALSRRAR